METTEITRIKIDTGSLLDHVAESDKYDNWDKRYIVDRFLRFKRTPGKLYHVTGNIDGELFVKVEGIGKLHIESRFITERKWYGWRFEID